MSTAQNLLPVPGLTCHALCLALYTAQASFGPWLCPFGLYKKLQMTLSTSQWGPEKGPLSSEGACCRSKPAGRL